MPELKVIYIAGFNLDKSSGRNKATREKTQCATGAFAWSGVLLHYIIPVDRRRDLSLI